MYLKYISDIIISWFCSVLTPYYDESVLFSIDELEEPNEDGVSILFYLQKIFPGFPVGYLFQQTAWSKSFSCYVKQDPTMITITLACFLKQKSSSLEM